ncbi:MAG TPA: DinB family protein [Cyclobacteriaceae bacterium]|nr:DinB family protein [Cyclobacteriaceae bacterium]
MKKILTLAFAFATAASLAQTTDLRSVLLEQLKTTHNKKDWFVPISVAVDGLTPEQAMWKDNSGNHSVGQLTYHLLFWNQRQLANFKGEKEAAFSGNNEETFNSFDKNSWAQTVAKLNTVMTELEKIVQTADEAKLKKWAPTIANISTHNAYHTGQIIFVRKLQGAWDPEKGVK